MPNVEGPLAPGASPFRLRIERAVDALQRLPPVQVALAVSLSACTSAALATVMYAAIGDAAIVRHRVLLRIALSTLALGLAATAALTYRLRRLPPPRRVSRASRVPRALLLSLGAWLLLMLYPAWLTVSPNPFRGVSWLAWGLEDYRWLFSTYLVTIASAVAIPPVAARLLTPTHELPSAPEPLPRRPARALLAVALGLVFAVACFAPPWNMELTSGEVGNHDVHLSQLQAIRTGSLPYIGPASVQYGPGSQLVQYAYMMLGDRFSLLGYRESYAFIFLAGFAVVSVLYCYLLGPMYGLLASALALCISPFELFGWNGPVFAGFWGWANPLRYMGALVVTTLVPQVVRTTRGWRNVPAFLLGLVWGVFTWLSQENLSISIVSIALLATTLWALGCCSLADVRGAAVNLAAGLTAWWLPVLAFYAAHGELARFLEGYFLVSGFVAAGMSNTPWDPVVNAGWNAAFYVTPYVPLAAAWIAIASPASRGFAARLPLERQRLLALGCVSLVCFTGALFRKDSSHFVNVLIALPAVVVALAKHAVHTRGPRLPRVLLVGALAAFVSLFPAGDRIPHTIAQYLVGRSARFMRPQPPASAWAGEHGVAFERAGAFASADYPIYEGAMPARAFLETMDRLRETIGRRPTYVHSFPQVPPEIVYFFADLTPGPILFNVWTMVFHTAIQQRFLDRMEQDCRGFGAMIATDSTAREIQIFRSCHPSAVELPWTIANRPFSVWLDGG